MRASMRLTPAVLVLSLLPASLPAQSDDRLDAAELAADAGELEQARQYLDSWLGSESASAPDAEVGRALYLRARLADDVVAAEFDYIDAAVRAKGPYGELARLRLAQLRLMTDRPALAVDDLDRLRVDYPDSPLVGESWLWRGYALESLGDPEAACEAWSNAAAGPASDPSAAQARAGLAACGSEAGVRDRPDSFTVQLGAFGSRPAAEDVRARAAGVGAEARILEPDGSTPLHRVRVGRFWRRDDAARMAVGLRSQGFEAIVVSEEP